MEAPVPILFIASRSDIAGGEVYLLNVMRHLDRRRYEPVLVLPGRGDFERALNESNVETHVVEANYGWVGAPKPWYDLVNGLDERVRRISAILTSSKVQLVHTNSNMILEGALAARLLGIHHVYLAHIEFQQNMPIFERFPISPASFAQLMGDLSSRVVAVSRSVAAALVPPLSPDQVQVIHNGLEFAAFDQLAPEANGGLRHELGLPADTVLVSSVGRIHPDKGNDLLIRCAADVVRQAQEVHFLHAGEEDDKPFADRVRGEVSAAGIADHFHFLGFRRDVPRLLAQSDIFVLSSRREGHPYVLLEAMASGCAAVATRCGGVEDTVKDRETGLLVGIEDTAGMAAAVTELAKNKVLRQAIGQKARTDVRSRFDAKASVAALMGVYDDVLSSPRPAAGSVAVDLFLRATHELGTLGTKVTEMEERLRQVEYLAATIQGSSFYKGLRRVRRWF